MADSASESRQGDAPRPLTREEHEVIEAILSEDVPGVVELRAQLIGMRVLRHWSPAGSPSVDLVTSPGTSRSPLGESILPVDASVVDDNGEYAGELILWLTDGRISSLEYSWVTDSMPRSLPPVRNMRVGRRLT